MALRHGALEGGATEYTITHHGVPVGTAELPSDGDRMTVAVEPLPAYAAIQPLVRDASCALADVALGRSGDMGALRRAAALGRDLELRDPAGALVPADFIELTEWPSGAPQVAAFIQLREAHAPVPARLPLGRSGGSEAAATEG